MKEVNTGCIAWKIIDREGFTTIWILGTNDARDILISTRCWPNLKGFHSGAYKAARRVFRSEEFQRELAREIPLEICGASMGGAIAECLAALVPAQTRDVVLYNSYPVTRKESSDYSVRRIIKGKEKVHDLFPWFRLTGSIERVEGDDHWPVNWIHDHIYISAPERQEFVGD